MVTCCDTAESIAGEAWVASTRKSSVCVGTRSICVTIMGTSGALVYVWTYTKYNEYINASEIYMIYLECIRMIIQVFLVLPIDELADVPVDVPEDVPVDMPLLVSSEFPKSNKDVRSWS